MIRPYSIVLSLFVSIRFQVLFHSPHWGSFHLSLTVLVHYRSVRSILPWRVVPPVSDKISRVPSYSGFPPGVVRFRIRDFHPLWSTFPGRSPINLPLYAGPTTPTLSLVSVWASSTFARRYLRNLVWLLFLQVLRCFSSLRLPLWSYFTYSTVTIVPNDGVSPFGHLRIKGCLAPLRRFRRLSSVLLRLLLPRYPPYTLSSFLYSWSSFSSSI